MNDELKIMNEDWVELIYKEAVFKISTTKQKLKQKEYLQEGIIPVVDQGKDKIGGFTNDEERILQCKLPVIVFGDHTKNVKLINFPFAPGADGTKVLQPKSNILPSYIAFMTEVLVYKIKDKGYARHYQYIEKEKFTLVSIPEQKAIVTKIEQLFSSLDSGIADLKKAQDQLKIYRQAVLKKAFEGAYSNKKYKIITIDSLCKVVRGGSPRPAGSNIFYNGDIPFMKVKDISRNKGVYVNKAEHSIKEAGLKKTRLVKQNTLLLTNSGATLGIPAITTIATAFNDGIAAFLELDDNLLYHYYYWCSKTIYLRNLNQGAAQPNLNTNVIGKMEIPIYFERKIHSEIVRQIESRLSVCDKVEQSITESLEKAKALRQSILKKAFEGKLLSEAEIAACKKDAAYEPASVLLERIQAEKLEMTNSKKKKK